MIDNDLIRGARRELLLRARTVRQLEFTPVFRKEVQLAEISARIPDRVIPDWFKRGLHANKNIPVVYRILANNQDTATRLKQAFNARNMDDGHKYPKDNRVDDSTTLYVGSSHKVRERMRQHLRDAAVGTYGLKMNLWCPNGEGSIIVEAQGLLSEPQTYSVQDVEDALWIASRPMLGKFGPK